MPYNPGVTDMSGQLRAQGIMSAANSYGQGMQAISGGIQAYKLKKEQDDALLAKAKSTETFIKAHSDLFGGEEAVKQMTATNPQEAPAAKYQRLAQVMQDTVVGNKIAQDQQQAQQAKAQAAFQQFQMQQAQRKAAQDDAQSARLQQILKMGGAPGGPGAAPQQEIDPMTAQALQYYKLTGRPPDPNVASAMIAQNSRQELADSRSTAATDVANARNETRKAIEDAKREIDKAKVDARTADPTFHTDPETGLRVGVYNGQMTVLPGQVAKDPSIAEIDNMEKNKDITHAMAVAAKKALIQHRATFSPNGGQALADIIARAQNPQAAPSPAAPAAGAPAGDFWGPQTQAQPAPVQQIKAQAPINSGVSPTGKTPQQQLIDAVRAGTMSAAQAKVIAQTNGWQ